MSLKTTRSVSKRVFELDFLRGIAIVMMVIMHTCYDVRYEFGFDMFGYLSSPFFWEFVHPIIVGLFVSVSGICCSFSRNNIKRGARILVVALLFTVCTAIATHFLDIYCLIIFNVLHLLALSTLIFGAIQLIEKKFCIPEERVNLFLGLASVYIILLNNNLDKFDDRYESIILMILGFDILREPYVADSMPVIPWMGIFFIGALIGRLCYGNKETLFPNISDAARRITRPIEFLGRHSLIIYLVHQPIVYGLLFLVFYLTGVIN